MFLALQQAERVFLMQEAWSSESPTLGVLIKTLWTGLRADLISATIALLIAVLLGSFIAAGLMVISRVRNQKKTFATWFRQSFIGTSCVMMLLIMGCLTIDMGYYHFNKQHLDFVFFEYMENLFTQAHEIGLDGAQAAQQTNAELQEGAKWGQRLAGFFLLEALAVLLWCLGFMRVANPLLDRWRMVNPALANSVLVVGLVSGLLGFHQKGPEAIRTARISSGTYYTLAQNPILYAGDALRATITAQWKDGAQLHQGGGQGHSREAPDEPSGDGSSPDKVSSSYPTSIAEAIPVAQELLARGQTFPYPTFPLVRTQTAAPGVRFDKPSNVLLIFVEALDRRYLGRTVEGIRLTPFMDRLKNDSVFLENFFANGAQTARGLFATFCSYYPRRGMSAMKTRYTHDYFCLPQVLRTAGYHNEMVIGYDRNVDRLHLFLFHNGMHQVLDESDFPPEVEQIGAASSRGKPDGALFDLIRGRIEDLQHAGQPFLLATETLTMHHPFHVPTGHPEVDALRANPDGYLPALRYFDLELERFFSRLREQGLLRNTVVFILGDHARHEHEGGTAIEKQLGHFLTPLFIWLDDSLRTPATYRPRTVSAVASQVDIMPTILAMNGLTPQVAPFLGQDMSCLLVRDCLQDNVAYLISPYGDEVIGLADQKGILVYGLRTEVLTHVDLEIRNTNFNPLQTDPRLETRYRQLQSLYASSNALLDRNMIWSWKELGNKGQPLMLSSPQASSPYRRASDVRSRNQSVLSSD